MSTGGPIGIQQAHSTNQSLTNGHNTTNTNTNTNPNNVPTNLPCSIALNSIRKRKVKFTIQLNIEELLSVPYLNGVLFCKARLCDGGNHVSYSSKKEVNNSKVLWSSDSVIQFDVKAIQLYSFTSTSPLITPLNKCYIIGYEPCLCRISVRKELRGGKSYQKLGYVDYNLSDYILKYQQDAGSSSLNEYCVNRILKEYDSSNKKNQQRLDNSFLKIKIKVFDQQKRSLNVPKLVLNNNVDKNINDDVKIKSSSSSPSSGSSSPLLNPVSKHNLKVNNNSAASVSLTDCGLNNKSLIQHNRNLSLNDNSSMFLNFINKNNNNGSVGYVSSGAHGHNRSCSNGSIKSNISFDFIIKNRNNKLIEDIQSTSSGSSLTNSGLMMTTQMSSNSFNSNQNNFSNSSSYLSTVNNKNSTSISSMQVVLGPLASNVNNGNKLEPANLRVIETRIDANEIISEIENELANMFK